MTASKLPHPDYNDAATLNRVAIWSPLPGAGDLSAEGKYLVRESEMNIRKDQMESALDASLGLNAVEPLFIPGFIRTAELLVATQRRDHARRLLRTISIQQATFDEGEFELELSKVRAHVDQDIEQSLRLANQILRSDQQSLVVPYVPAVIEQLYAADRAADSTQVASDWVALTPDDPLALAFLVRAHLRQNNGDEAFRTIRRFRDEFEADRVWPENLVVSALTAISSDHLEPKWMAAGPVCHELRNGSLNYRHVTALLEFLIPTVDSPQRALLFAGLLALNAGDLKEADALFQTTAVESPVETFIRNTGLERIAQGEHDQRARLTALQECWRALADKQVQSIAESGDLFDPPANRERVGISVAKLLQASGSYSDALKFLNELLQEGHESAEVVRLHAEVMGQSGSRGEALAELEALLERQEAAHRYAAAIETLESMIRLVPGNVRFRGQVVEHSLKIGQFDQAIEQLVMQARLLHRAGKLSEAEPPIHRAIEISTMVNDWENVEKLHRLLISFDPEETRLRHAAVTTYVQYGRTSEAMNQLREIIRLARKRNDPDEAIAASHQMLALDPNDPGTYHQLGELLISIQEYGQADRVYRRLGTIVPDDPVVKAKRSAIAALTRARPGAN